MVIQNYLKLLESYLLEIWKKQKTLASINVLWKTKPIRETQPHWTSSKYWVNLILKKKNPNIFIELDIFQEPRSHLSTSLNQRENTAQSYLRINGKWNGLSSIQGIRLQV